MGRVPYVVGYVEPHGARQHLSRTPLKLPNPCPSVVAPVLPPQAAEEIVEKREDAEGWQALAGSGSRACVNEQFNGPAQVGRGGRGMHSQAKHRSEGM